MRIAYFLGYLLCVFWILKVEQKMSYEKNLTASFKHTNKKKTLLPSPLTSNKTNAKKDIPKTL